jgi:hypothetical protein
MEAFKVNDTITLSNRFFHNHGIKEIDLEVGTIQGMIEPTPNSLPVVLVRFQYHPSFATVKELHDLLVTNGNGNHLTVLVGIHPVYLEKTHERNKTNKDYV